MHPHSPNSSNVLKDGSEVDLDCRSLEELFLALEAGRIEPFLHGEITPLGRWFLGDRCEKPVEHW